MNNISSLNDVTVNVCGKAGAGKSTIARIIVETLLKEGFVTLLVDQDSMNKEQFKKCKKALFGRTVNVVCGKSI